MQLARSDRPRQVIVVGAGIGGLVCAVICAAAGLDVTVIEKALRPGGKLREIEVGGRQVDSGPTVLTMPHVFEDIFRLVGARFEEHVPLDAEEILARHHWPDGSSLDLFVDPRRSERAIADFAGEREARGYQAFRKAGAGVYDTLFRSFIDAETPSIPSLTRSAGILGLPKLARIRAFSTLWAVICEHFADPRLRQLFGRYATYCGSSPFEAPGPLMLIAHVEQQGVWRARNGMHSIARAIADLAASRGAQFVYGCEASAIESSEGRTTAVVARDGRRFPADAIVFNGDPVALAQGLLGPDVKGSAQAWPREERSLSAVTLSMVAKTSGFPLAHHNVFFSADCAGEFSALRDARALPPDPTVYLCAQDRGASRQAVALPERLFSIVNAPPDGDRASPTVQEIDRCTTATLARLEAAGLVLSDLAMVRTTPADFHGLFPATGGALYGRATHGWAASFQRPTARTAKRGLYLAGGAVHPGAGLPMAALSGRNAARAVLRDLASTAR